MDLTKQIIAVLAEVLSLRDGGAGYSDETILLGAIAELDSMAVVALITTLEDRFGIIVDDDDIDGATFASVGSLTKFIETKLVAE